MTAPEWRDCADPDELAAAVAAGVEVCGGNGPAWPSTMRRARDFAECIEAGTQYWLPDGWSPEPPADDLREHLERCVDSLDQFVRDHDDPGTEALAAIHEARQALGRGATPTPPPTPPWPGAVLSGLCDEDGVPTWLAQAGDVRGEQVRGWRDMAWYRPDGHSSDTWVEVRAPRAMPEPETERVPWWDAVGRTVFDQDGEPVTIEHVECGDGAGPNVTAYNAAKRRDHGLFRVPCPVWGDGTVEVLKDGDQ